MKSRGPGTRLIALLLAAGLVGSMASSALVYLGASTWVALAVIVVVLAIPIVAALRSRDQTRRR